MVGNDGYPKPTASTLNWANHTSFSGVLVLSIFVSYVINDLIRIFWFNFYVKHQAIMFNFCSIKPLVNVYVAVSIILKLTKTRQQKNVIFARKSTKTQPIKQQPCIST